MPRTDFFPLLLGFSISLSLYLVFRGAGGERADVHFARVGLPRCLLLLFVTGGSGGLVVLSSSTGRRFGAGLLALAFQTLDKSQPSLTERRSFGRQHLEEGNVRKNAKVKTWGERKVKKKL